MRTNLGILALCMAAISATACKNDKPEPVGTTTTTSSEIALGTQQSAAPAPDSYLATVRREQLVLRGRIDDELRAIDRQLVEQKRAANKDPKVIHDLETKRLTLRADSEVLDRSDERGWDELKAVVEHDLEGEPEM